jgi:hypothetical protein
LADEQTAKMRDGTLRVRQLIPDYQHGPVGSRDDILGHLNVAAIAKHSDGALHTGNGYYTSFELNALGVMQ